MNPKLIVTLDYVYKKLISSSKSIQPKSLILIRLDAIGDYVLFRNFIEALRKSEEFREYKITLLGNAAWKSLFEILDSEFVDETIWLDRTRFKEDLSYRYQILKKLAKKAYQVLICPTYSREYFVTDSIVNYINAEEKIGSSSNNTNISIALKKISDRYYSKLLPANPAVMFEFERNKEFMQNLLKKELTITRPSIKIDIKQKHFELPQKYIVLFIGGSADFKKWPITKFIAVATHLQKRGSIDIILCGGVADQDEAKQFELLYNYPVINLVGKTSLVELLLVIKNAELMISNETSAPHIAVALDIPTIVLYNGSYFGRFAPYPDSITQKHFVVYHPEIQKNLESYFLLSNSYRFANNLDINEIGTQEVIEKAEYVLEQNKE
jgi:ADP-heptose:LPS heptosyltransferase